MEVVEHLEADLVGAVLGAVAADRAGEDGLDHRLVREAVLSLVTVYQFKTRGNLV